MASTTVTLSAIAVLFLATLTALPASANPSSARWIAMPEEHHATLAGHSPPQGMDEADLQSIRVPRSLSALSSGAVELAESDMAKPLVRLPRRAPQLASEQPSRGWMVSSLANLNRRRRSADSPQGAQGNLARQLMDIRGLYEMYEPAEQAAYRAPRAAAWQLPVEPAPLICYCGADHGADAVRIARGTPKGELAKDESCYKPAVPGEVLAGKPEGAAQSGEDLPDDLQIATNGPDDVVEDECHANIGELSPHPKAAKQESASVLEAIDELEGQAPSDGDFITDEDEILPEPEPESEADQPPSKAELKKVK